MIGMIATIFLCLIALVIFILGQNKEEIGEQLHRKWSVLFEHHRKEHQRFKRIYKQSKK